MSDKLEFLPGMAEHLKHYVYALVDPRPGGGIFYVGKGVKDRVYHHARASLSAREDQELGLKLNTIREIQRAGLEVGVEIIRHGMDERTAFEVEAGVIDALKLAGVSMTNRAIGIDSVARGWHPLTELQAIYAAPPLEAVTERLILIKINRLYRPDMTPSELYEATRKWWRCRPSRDPHLALAVYLGVVRAVYRIEDWEKAPVGNERERGRYGFRGAHADDLAGKYEWHNVRHLVGKTQNPIKYANC